MIVEAVVVNGVWAALSDGAPFGSLLSCGKGEVTRWVSVVIDVDSTAPTDVDSWLPDMYHAIGPSGFSSIDSLAYSAKVAHEWLSAEGELMALVGGGWAMESAVCLSSNSHRL